VVAYKTGNIMTSENQDEIQRLRAEYTRREKVRLSAVISRSLDFYGIWEQRTGANFSVHHFYVRAAKLTTKKADRLNKQPVLRMRIDFNR
jgi:hypothetical protein